VSEQFVRLVSGLCETAGLDTQTALNQGAVEIDGFPVQFHHTPNDPEAMYLHFDFGTVVTIRMLRCYQLMLESNLTLYAQDQAQLCLDPATQAAVLTVRIPMSDEIDGAWLVTTCNHYTEHGKYWRDNVSNAHDDMFNGLCEGHYMWMRT
jgi:hypothetical protein